MESKGKQVEPIDLKNTEVDRDMNAFDEIKAEAIELAEDVSDLAEEAMAKAGPWVAGTAVETKTFLVRTFGVDRVAKQTRKAMASLRKGHEGKAALRAIDATLAAGAGGAKAMNVAATALPGVVGRAVPALPLKVAAALWEAFGNGALAFKRAARGLERSAQGRAKLGLVQAGWGLAGVAVSLAAAAVAAMSISSSAAPWIGLAAGEAWGWATRKNIDKRKANVESIERQEIDEVGWRDADHLGFLKRLFDLRDDALFKNQMPSEVEHLEKAQEDRIGPRNRSPKT